MVEKTEKKYIDHITLPPETEDSQERTYWIADKSWRDSAAKNITPAQVLRWNKNISGNFVFTEEKGNANGVAPLNGRTKIDNSYLSIFNENNKINNEYLPSRIESIKIGNNIIVSPDNNSQIQFSAGDNITIQKDENNIIFSARGNSTSESNINNLIDGQYVEGALRGVGTAENVQPPAEGDPPVVGQYYMGEFATALGIGTKANSDASLTIGKYNSQDVNKNYAFIIGNGTNEEGIGITQSNALTVDWNGNVKVNDNAIIPTNNNHLTSKAYVDSQVGENLNNIIKDTSNIEKDNEIFLVTSSNITSAFPSITTTDNTLKTFDQSSIIESNIVQNIYKVDSSNKITFTIPSSYSSSTSFTSVSNISKGSVTRSSNTLLSITPAYPTTIQIPTNNISKSFTISEFNVNLNNGTITLHFRITLTLPFSHVGNHISCRGRIDIRGYVVSGTTSFPSNRINCTVVPIKYHYFTNQISPYIVFGDRPSGFGVLKGGYSSTFGKGLVATQDYDFVIGKYNNYQEQPQETVYSPEYIISPGETYDWPFTEGTYLFDNTIIIESQKIDSEQNSTTFTSTFKGKEEKNFIYTDFTVSYDGEKTFSITVDNAFEGEVVLHTITRQVPNYKNYLFTIGNGTGSNNRSNAIAVTPQGNIQISGTPSENNHVVTKSYIDNAISNIQILSTGLANPSYGNWKLPWINLTDPDTGIVYNLSINQNQNQLFTFNFNAKQAGSDSWTTLASIVLN